MGPLLNPLLKIIQSARLRPYRIDNGVTMFADQTDKNIGREDLPRKANGRKYQCSMTYQPEDCDTVLRLMRDGCTLNEVARHLEISMRTMARWRKEIPEFEEACQTGVDWAQAWHEKAMRDHMIIIQEKDAPKVIFNDRIAIFVMRSRFKITDTLTPIVVNIDSETNVDKVDEIVKRLHKESV